MAKFYDISAKITNELPTLKITDDITVTINSRKNTILNVMAMINEIERKKKNTPEDDQDPNADFDMMQKALEMLIGEKRANEIYEMNLPIVEYKEVFQAVFMIAQGKDPGETDTP